MTRRRPWRPFWRPMSRMRAAGRRKRRTPGAWRQPRAVLERGMLWPRIKSPAPGPLRKRPLGRKKLPEEREIPAAGPETAASRAARTALAPALSGTAAGEGECPTGSRRIPMCFTAAISRARPWRSMRSPERSARWSYGERSSGWKKGSLEAAAR